MSDQIPDLSDFENLPLYDVVKNLAIETRKPRSLWLHRIAKSACTEKEPLNDDTVPPLRLFPKDHWCIIHVSNTRTIRSHGIGGDFEIKPGQTPKRFESTTWQLKESGLRAYKNLQDVHEVPHTQTVLETEGVTINKKEFAKWCLASGYPLPKFWFGDSKQIEHGTSPHEEHNPRKKPEGTPYTERMDPLRALIVKVLQEDISPDTESVWLALLDRKGDGTIICGQEDVNGSVIKWKDSEGNFKTLTKKALRGRIQRLK